MPEARKFSATPAISWLPRKVIEVSPWIRRKDQRPADPRQGPQPGRPGVERHRARAHRGDQHLALKPDVEDARAFGVKPGEAGQQQRRGQPQGRVEDLQKRCVIHHAASIRLDRNTAKMRTRSIRTIMSSAPVNRITSP